MKKINELLNALYKTKNLNLTLFQTLIFLFLGFSMLGLGLLYNRYIITYSGIAIYFFLFLYLLKHIFPLLVEFVDKYFNNDIKEKYPLKSIIILSIIYSFMIAILSRTSPDTITQWNQVQEFKFHDWHPVTHTFLIWLVTRIYNNQQFFLIVQAIFYAFTLGCIWKALINNCRIDKGLVTFSMLIPALSHPITKHLRIAWKDTTMMVFFLAITFCIIQIVATKGEWFKSIRNSSFFIILLVLGTLMRHNAFFFIFPLLFTLWILIEKNFLKQYVIICILILLSLGIIKQVVIPAFCETDKNQGYIEAIGIPMGIMSSMYAADSESVPQEVALFLEPLTPANKDWSYYHTTKGFNQFKSAFVDEYLVKISAVPFDEFLNLFINTIKHSPLKALNAFWLITAWPWSFFSWPGCWLYILWFVSIFSFPFIKWKILPFLLPTLSYQIGTTLLLYGEDYRFFVYIVALSILLSLLMLVLQNRAVTCK